MSMVVRKQTYGGLDRFRIIAALLVVAIHTAPLASFSVQGDYVLTHILGRIAVPFFFMISGHFLLSQYVFERSTDAAPLVQFLKKTGLYYLVATIIYIPILLYSGQLGDASFYSVVQALVFEGTFYHLWYFPAVMLGAVLVYGLSRIFSAKSIIVIVVCLYFFGLFGDSYFGLVQNIPVVSAVYEAVFKVSSYTRNGFFFAPLFLVFGAWLGSADISFKRSSTVVGLIVSLLLLICEGLLLYHFNIPRHDSMYIMLLPCMLYLYRLLLSWEAPSVKRFRSIATWVYIIHPLFIVVVRGVAKWTDTVPVLVENSLIHFILVAGASFLFAVVVSHFLTRKRPKSPQPGRAWMEVSRGDLAHNVTVLKGLLPSECELMPAVKANAYGHGATLLARELNAMGVQAFCVACVAEGMKLRKAGVKGEILILGYTHPAQFSLLRRYRLTQTVVDAEYARLLHEYGKKIAVHIKVDTGMHRLGERSENLNEILTIFSYKNLEVQGVFTHLCAASGAEAEHEAYTRLQAQKFDVLVKYLRRSQNTQFKMHALGSYGILNYSGLGGDYTRPGIALYGLLSTRRDRESCRVDLKPLASIKTRVSTVKTLRQGEAVGYDLQFVAERDTVIATLGIGYADGIPRSLSCGVGNVLIDGVKVPIIGRICMDQLMVDVTQVPHVLPGNIAVIVGKSGTEEITFYDLAEQSGTITNEIASGLSTRLERVLID